MSGHTPGPWRVGPIHKDGSYAIHAETASVVHCTPMASSGKAAKPNAHLIAAAPAMLEALQIVRKCAGFPDNVRKQIDEIISIATGETR